MAYNVRAETEKFREPTVCGSEHECPDGWAMGHYCTCAGPQDGLSDYVCQGKRWLIYLRARGNEAACRDVRRLIRPSCVRNNTGRDNGTGDSESASAGPARQLQ